MLFAAARVLRARQSWRFSGLTEAPIGAIITKWSEGRRPAFSTFACTAIMKTPLIIIAASLVSLPLAADITLPGRRAPKLPPLPPDWTEEEEPPAAQTPAPTAPGTPISAGADDPAATSPGAPADPAAGAVPSAGQSPASGIPATSGIPGTSALPTAADAAQAATGAASPKPAPNPQDEALAEGLDEMTDILRSVHDAASADAAALELALKVKAGKATTDEIARLVQFTKEHGGIEYAVASMHRYRDEALAQLAGLADTDVRRALEAYVAYVVDRDK